MLPLKEKILDDSSNSRVAINANDTLIPGMGVAIVPGDIDEL